MLEEIGVENKEINILQAFLLSDLVYECCLEFSSKAVKNRPTGFGRTIVA